MAEKLISKAFSFEDIKYQERNNGLEVLKEQDFLALIKAYNEGDPVKRTLIMEHIRTVPIEKIIASDFLKITTIVKYESDIERFLVEKMPKIWTAMVDYNQLKWFDVISFGELTDLPNNRIKWLLIEKKKNH